MLPAPLAVTDPASAPSVASDPSVPSPADESHEEDLGFIQRIAAFATPKVKLATANATLAARITALEAQLTERNEQIATLTAENDRQRADLARVGTWLVENGHAGTREAATDPAAAFVTAVGTNVAAAVRQIGVPAATLITQPASAGAAGNEDQLDTLIAEMNAERDPVKKGKICDKVTALRQQLSKAKSN